MQEDTCIWYKIFSSNYHYKQNISLPPHLLAIVLSPLTLLGSPELIKNRIVDNTEDNILQL